MKQPTSPLFESWLDEIQGSGYRLTGPRRALVEIIAGSARVLDPLALFDLGRRRYPGLGLVTVYRTLEKLEELGLVQRVHQPGGCQGYLRAARGHEHLLICTSCGLAEYFSGDDLNDLMGEIAGRTHFIVEGHWLQLYGRCAGCQRQTQPVA